MTIQNVLLIDDDNDFLIRLKMAISKNFLCHMESSNHGIEGFAKAEKSPFELIFVDLKMPLMSGDYIVNAIREKPGPNQETTIIILTAYPKEAKKISYKFKNVLVLEKGGNFESVMATISNYLKKLN